MSVWRHSFRLFVDDGVFACLVLAWIAFVALLREAAVPSAAVNVLLCAGLLLLFAGRVWRAARKRRRV
jgi:hypothetical protein